MWYVGVMSLNENQGIPDPDIPRDARLSAETEADAGPAEAKTELAEVANPGSGLPDQDNTTEVATENASIRPANGRRRWFLPFLFVATCVSTFFVGCTVWNPYDVLYEFFINGNGMPLRRSIVRFGADGLIYMGCLIAILLTHEMGHYLAAVRYRIHATPPMFIPFPISPFGTMGAVIGMKGMQADRRQIFDIGIAGPLAGLVVALPVMWIGIQKLDLTEPGMGAFRLDLPIAVEWTMAAVKPKGYTPDAQVWQNQLNPYFMAGWVGFLITGLNMMPVSQLDGGHVSYTLFGRWANWAARSFMVVLIGMIALDWLLFFPRGETGLQVGNRWWLMALLVFLIGTDHPPTRDDNVPLGWGRTILGLLSLSIPVFCFAPRVLYFN